MALFIECFMLKTFNSSSAAGSPAEKREEKTMKLFGFRLFAVTLRGKNALVPCAGIFGDDLCFILSFFGFTIQNQVINHDAQCPRHRRSGKHQKRKGQISFG